MSEVIIVNEETTTKREKIKGHYRNVTRGIESGRIITSEKWTPPMSPCILCFRLKIGSAYQEDPNEYKNPSITYGYCEEYKQYRQKTHYPNCRNPAIGSNSDGWVRWAKNHQRGLEKYVEALENLLKETTQVTSDSRIKEGKQ